jgi:hypothetical protein
VEKQYVVEVALFLRGLNSILIFKVREIYSILIYSNEIDQLRPHLFSVQNYERRFVIFGDILELTMFEIL